MNHPFIFLFSNFLQLPISRTLTDGEANIPFGEIMGKIDSFFGIEEMLVMVVLVLSIELGV